MTDPILGETAAPLRETRFDLIAFFGAFFTGLVLHFSLRFLGAPSWVIEGAIVMVLAAYAVVAGRIPRLRVRLDQAGDNAYYLGLLFTLVSMAVALYEFGTAVSHEGEGGTAAETIIANFGIALASTIAGIFLRVLLHQMRVDPADVEGMTRIELAEASQRVRATLDVVTSDIARFHLELGQRTGDIVATAVGDSAKRVDDLVAQRREAFDQMATAAAASQEELLSRTRALLLALTDAAKQAIEAGERLKAIEPPPLTLSRRLDRAGSAIETIGARLEGVAAGLDGVLSRASAVATNLSLASERIAAASSEAAQDRIRAAQALAEGVAGVGAALGQVGGQLKVSQQLLVDLEQHSRRAAEESVRSQEAAVAVLQSLTSTVDEISNLLDRSPGDGPRSPT